MNKTKEIMSAWRADARERAPCVLILDGLDMLLMLEQEVRLDEHPYSRTPTGVRGIGAEE